MFVLTLKILPQPVNLWGLKVGDRFALNPTGFNADRQRFEVYIKLSQAKCCLESDPEKPVFTIAQLCSSWRSMGYRVLEEWKLGDGV